MRSLHDDMTSEYNHPLASSTKQTSWFIARSRWMGKRKKQLINAWFSRFKSQENNNNGRWWRRKRTGFFFFSFQSSEEWVINFSLCIIRFLVFSVFSVHWLLISPHFPPESDKAISLIISYCQNYLFHCEKNSNTFCTIFWITSRQCLKLMCFFPSHFISTYVVKIRFNIITTHLCCLVFPHSTGVDPAQNRQQQQQQRQQKPQ